MNKRDDILQAAEKLFYTHGFHATSTDQICAAAKVSTRTFYRYFPSREMLTQCVMEERQTRFFADLHPSDHPQAVNKLFAVLEPMALSAFAALSMMMLFLVPRQTLQQNVADKRSN